MTEVEKLRQMAIDNYETDHGFMCECSDQADYEAAIAEHGTAAKAWSLHMRCIEAQKETQAYYDIDPKEGW